MNTQKRINKHNEHMAKQIFGKAMTLRMPATETKEVKMMDLANRDTDQADFDARYEAQEALQAMIDARVDDYLKDDDSVEQLIADNSDVIWSIIKSKKDVQDKLMESIKHWAENEVEEHL